MWNPYEIAALFSPIFLELKKRFKLLLNERCRYCDGMTPEEIGRLSKLTHSKFLVEDDLTK